MLRLYIIFTVFAHTACNDVYVSYELGPNPFRDNDFEAVDGGFICGSLENCKAKCSKTNRVSRFFCFIHEIIAFKHH